MMKRRRLLVDIEMFMMDTEQGGWKWYVMQGITILVGLGIFGIIKLLVW